MRDTPKDLEQAPVYGRQIEGKKSTFNIIETNDLATDRYFAQSLARQCYESSTNWINAGRRLKWNDSLRSFQGIHPSGSKYLSTDYRYRSRLFRPKTRSMVRKAEASTAQAFFANEDIVNISAVDDDNPHEQASAEIMQRLLQYRLTKTIPWFQTLVGARQDAEVMGICLGKVYWKYAEKYSHTEARPVIHPITGSNFNENGEEHTEDYDIFDKMDDHPWIDLIPPENFRFDPGADWRNPIVTSPYTIEIIPMYIIDVKSKVESGEWLPVSEGSMFSAADLDDDVTRRGRENNRVPGKASDAWKPRAYDICWVRENIIRHGGQDYHYYSLSGADELLTLPKPIDEVYLQGIRPYVCGNVVTEAHKVYPTSKVELIKDLQTQTNDITNLRLDNVKLSLNPRQFLAAGLGIDPQDMRVFMPGKTVISTSKAPPSESIYWDRPPDVTGSSYQEQDRLNMDFDELVGGISASGIEANRQTYQAVGNMEMMQGNASQLEEYDQRVFAETFVEPIIRHLVKLEQAYETNPVILGIAGKEAQLWQKFGINEITDDLLKRELTIKVNVGIGSTNPKQKLQNFATGADLVGKLFGPAAAMGANFEEIVKEVFSLCGYKDGGRFFMPGFDIHAAMQQMQQGKGGKPDDTQGKIALAQAQQQAQAQQDGESHKMEMAEMQLDHQQKLQEMQMKFQLETEKMNQTRHAQMMQQNQQMMDRPATPAATVQFNADDALNRVGQNIEGMAQKHSNAIDTLGSLMTPLAHVTNAIGQTLQATHQHMAHQSQMMQDTMNHGHQMHQSLTAAIDKLNKPRKRKVIRDEQGRLTGAEDYE